MCLLGSATSARADLILSAQSVQAKVGTSGAFDVSLTNTGPNSVTVGGFSFRVSVNNPGITLTQINTSTAIPYIFAGQSLSGPIITTPGNLPGQSMSASDARLTGGTLLAPGATLGLGHVLFNLSSGLPPGVYPVTITPPGFGSLTSLSDPNGNPLPLGTAINGTITAVPEPASLLLLVAATGFVVVSRRRRSATR